MYKKIMVPVDLAHTDKLDKALKTAADLSKHYAIPICFISVTATTPGSVAHNPDEFAAKLEAFGHTQAQTRNLKNVSTAAYTSHDPTVDLDDTLMKAIKETGSDLVIMASHIPGIPEYIFSSNAGYLAQHSKVSIFVIR